MSLGISACRKHFFCLTHTLTSSFVSYFFLSGSSGGLKSVLGVLFSDTLINLEALKRIFLRGPKMDFFLKGLVQGQK